jgi:hypothetical protein
MKKHLFFLLLTTIIGFIACKKEEATTPAATTDQPVGAFTATRTGSLVAQNGTPTAGTVQLGTDTKSTVFLKLNSNYKSDYHSGAVTLYLSKGATYKTETVQLISGVSKDGEQYFKVTPSVGNEFTHLIVWCSAAKIPFGNAELK